MGFHKRWICKEQLISSYRISGIKGIKDYFGKADAFISEDDLSHDVIDLYNSNKLTSIEKWDEISMIVSIASIKNWKYEKEEKTTTSS
jgi:hypothetical protein